MPRECVPYQNLPIAPADYPWPPHVMEVIDRLKQWARNDFYWVGPAFLPSYYKRAFLVHNPSQPYSLMDYLFPFADVIGGKLMAVPDAVKFVRWVLQPSGVWCLTISDEMRDNCLDHIQKYIDRLESP